MTAPVSTRPHASRHPSAGQTGAGILHIVHSSPDERISTIRAGIPAHEIEGVASAMKLTKEEFMAWLGIPRATVNRKVRNDERLSPEHSERLLGVARLIGKVQTMVEESGDATGFDAAEWASAWLDAEQPVLGGRRPAEYMDTMEGQQLVLSLLEMTQSGAYA